MPEGVRSGFPSLVGAEYLKHIRLRIEGSREIWKINAFKTELTFIWWRCVV